MAEPDTILYRLGPNRLVALREGEELWPYLDLASTYDAYAVGQIDLEELERRVDHFVQRERDD